jgi:SgrR family transcriptional regulator
MATPRLLQQYTRLHQAYDGQTIVTTLQELADRLFCTRRHMRNIVAEWQALGWIEWLARSGRGGRSTLSFLFSVEALQRERALSLIDSGRFEQAVGLLNAEPDELAAFLMSRLGQRWDRGRQVLTVPYYRALPNLVPTALQRRSERHLARQIFNGLTVINEEKGEVEPDLAHRWQTSDQCEWHFHLRPAVRWHDGQWMSISDVVASLRQLCELPMFEHVRDVCATSPRTVTLSLSESDRWLPWLLAEPYAAILPADHERRPDFAARPVGTGPFRVAVNDSYRLSLRAFDDYFGFRALIDEVDILMVPSLAQLDSAGTMSVRGSQGEGGNSSTLIPESGGYFLLCDGRHAVMRDDATRHFLGHVLAPLEILHTLAPERRRYWTPAHGLLPGWHHVPPDVAVSLHPPGGLRVLRVAFPEQQPDYETLVAAMRACLVRYGIELDARAVPYADWACGAGEFELWLGSAIFPTRLDFAVPAWLFGSRLARLCLPDLPISDWQSEWRGGRFDEQAMAATLVGQRCLLPMVHTWFHLKGTQQLPGVRINNLGWVDFKSAWLE